MIKDQDIIELINDLAKIEKAKVKQYQPRPRGLILSSGNDREVVSSTIFRYKSDSHEASPINPFNSDLLKAARASDLKSIDEAIRKGARPAGNVYPGVPVLYTICIEGSHDIAIYLIKKFKDSVFSRTDKGHTILYATLMNAMEHNKLMSPVKTFKNDKKTTLELIELIIKSGENIDVVLWSCNGGSILHHVDDEEYFEALLKYNPNPFIKDNDGRTPRQHYEFHSRITPPKYRMSYHKICSLLEAYEKTYKDLKKPEVENESLNGDPNMDSNSRLALV